MTVPAATVRSLCNSAEAAIVRASRRPEISQLSPVELKRMAERARKHFDKWNKMSREQARKKVRQTGTSATPKNTQQKAEIFREALERFEAQLAKAEAAPAAAKGSKPKPKTKKARATEHRTSRAAVRKGMTAVEDLLNRSARKKGK